MTRGFRKMLLLGGLFRWLRPGGLLSIARLLLTLLRIARLLPLAFVRLLLAISCSCGAWSVITSLPMGLARRARRFRGKVGGRHKAVNFDYRDFTFDQSLYVPEERQFFLVHQ